MTSWEFGKPWATSSEAGLQLYRVQAVPNRLTCKHNTTAATRDRLCSTDRLQTVRQCTISASLPRPRNHTDAKRSGCHTFDASLLTHRKMTESGPHTFNSQPTQLGCSQGPQRALEGSKRSPDCSHNAHICNQGETGMHMAALAGANVYRLHDAHNCSQGKSRGQGLYRRTAVRSTTQQLVQCMTNFAQTMHAAT